MLNPGLWPQNQKTQLQQTEIQACMAQQSIGIHAYICCLWWAQWAHKATASSGSHTRVNVRMSGAISMSNLQLVPRHVAFCVFFILFLEIDGVTARPLYSKEMLYLSGCKPSNIDRGPPSMLRNVRRTHGFVSRSRRSFRMAWKDLGRVRLPPHRSQERGGIMDPWGS